MMKFILLLALACASILPTAVLAGPEQTDRCHCFRDRTYDPNHKSAADDYLLATSYNSLIAAALGVSKRQIILMKMKGGIDPDELLTALYIADKTGSSVDLLLSIRDNGGSWQTILKAPALQYTPGEDPVLTAIAGGAAPGVISRRITEAMLAARYHIQPEAVRQLRDQGFSDRETSLIIALEQLRKVPAESIVTMARQDTMSWSEIAHSFELTPSSVGKMILNQ